MLSSEFRTQFLAKHGREIVLSFSRGKDAIATWIALEESGYVVKPFFLETVPGLSFVQESLAYYERVFHTPILRVPHPSLLRMLENLVYQPPERAAALEDIDWPRYENEDADNLARETLGNHYVATGVRTADSPVRMVAFKTRGPVNEKRRVAWPIYDWKKADVFDTLRRRGIGLPIDYKWFGRSFDGIDARFLEPLKRHSPADYAKVLDWFPLAHLGFERFKEST